MLAGEGEAAVGEAKKFLLLVEGQGRISPPDLSKPQLQVIEELAVHPALLGLRAVRWPWCPPVVHLRIIRGACRRTMALWR